MDPLKMRMKCLDLAQDVKDAAEKLRTAFAFECYVYGGVDIGMDMLRLDPATFGVPPIPAQQPFPNVIETEDAVYDGFSTALLH